MKGTKKSTRIHLNTPETEIILLNKFEVAHPLARGQGGIGPLPLDLRGLGK